MTTFSNLHEAIEIIANALKSNDITPLKESSIDELPADWVLERLKAKHEELSLPKLYAEIDFPSDSETFKLGGHNKELGHIHIDFIKKENAWYLKQIWMCR